MKTIQLSIYCTLCLVIFISCSSSSKIGRPVPPEPISSIENVEESTTSELAAQVISTAKSYLGTPYQYGGTNADGLDCSGLVLCSFQSVNISLPRSSHGQARVGTDVQRNDIQQGDILFFAQPGGEISHSGIVEKVLNDNITFIHSSLSKGVIISSLNERYWKKRFVKAVRVID